MQNSKNYRSGEIHDKIQATNYSQTHESPHRFLAYRDFSKLTANFPQMTKVLDFGSGTGASTHYLFQKGYDVIGVDKSPSMVDTARLNFPKIQFKTIEELYFLNQFDLVFSSFVLFELASKNEITNYLNAASSALKDEGIFFGVTGSENLHHKKRNWMCFNVNYKENSHPHSGSIVKLGLKEPKMEFYDYYWQESDYKECFQNSKLDLLQIHHPLASENEPFEWKDELFISPFIIFIAKRKN